MQNNIKPKFLRAKGIAKHFGIGESTVWYYLKIGKIKSKKILFSFTRKRIPALTLQYKIQQMAVSRL